MKAKTIQLTHEEIKIILRAADSIIAEGGRTLLAKMLKGSREKKVLELELDKNPAYGFYKQEKLEVVMEKIDWMIDHSFLTTEYFGKLPMIVFTERGWLIESDQYTDELIHEWEKWIFRGKTKPDMNYLKDRNRGMILLMLQKIRESGNKSFIPYLTLWKENEYKKFQAEISQTIKAIEEQVPVDEAVIRERENKVQEALKGVTLNDYSLKCFECGERFVFPVAEQRFYRQKGFKLPKRCPECREKKWK
ncbi:RQC-minor-1 family DNA-binding protein [Bacillus weihaiensis]|uniref:Superfamily II DNA helicase n=1 Tax=Bacillus weihaiensis TaxID=1547283 RepID=A0A1L3MVD2_9BACI|nr:RQC-minor-1 family DNA-binding protein [Bacillus weihaiensis]APH06303.1 superfamily II DNA helicase [Bacillus weihaiensis]